MADLSTSYMGIPLKNPLVVAASAISNHVDQVKRCEELGAGALVIRSLFEEQILHDDTTMADFMERAANISPEIHSSFYPPVDFGGGREHMMWVEKTRRAVAMPIFASLNAITPGSWVPYARQLAETGIDGLELNYYYVAADPDVSGAELEQRLIDIVADVKQAVNIPVAVKLSPFYTSVANLVKQLEAAGAEAVVLFNRFLQPTIDIQDKAIVNEMALSHEYELKLPLRWIALLYGRTKLDLVLNTGVASGADVIKGLLAGASAVQIASALFRNGLPYLSTLQLEIESWMEENGYDTIDEFRGTV